MRFISVRLFTLIVMLMAVAPGCTATGLHRSVAQQGSTVMDLYYRQVLDNVALLNTVPGTLPHFAIASGGTAQVTDSGGLDTLMLGWQGGTSAADILGRRDVVESWSLLPIAEPDRLRAMQAAFEAAITGQFRVAYALVQNDDTERNQLLANILAEPVPAGWFSVGRWYNVPVGAPFGSYGRTYVWVLPGRMYDFSKFTLMILKLATVALTPQREVTIGHPTDGKTVYETRITSGVTYDIPRMAPSPQFYPQGR